jgi:hypothetical protein
MAAKTTPKSIMYMPAVTPSQTLARKVAKGEGEKPRKEREIFQRDEFITFYYYDVLS